MRAIRAVAVAVALVAALASVDAMTYRPGMRLHPISTMPQQNYSVMNGATVSIEEGYAAGDQLMLDYAGEFDIKSNFDTRTGTLFISGFATVSEYSRAIQDVVFTTSSELGGSRRVTWSFGENTLYSTRTRHFYKFINDTGASWSKGNDTCAATQWYGMQGYLATVTSDVEMDALSRKAWMSVWIAGKADADWQWSWAAGPERTWPAFWGGSNMYRGGAPLNGGYSAWGRFQPSNKSGDVFVALQPSEFDAYSSWFAMQARDGLDGFLCEFGGLDSVAVAATASNYAGTVVLEFGCSEYTTQNECNNQRELGCSWSGSCSQSSCLRFPTDALCTGQPGCEWNVKGAIGMCVSTPCGSFDERTCQKADGCEWAQMAQSASTDTVTEVCVETRCNMASQAPECGSLTPKGCMWEDSKCFDQSGLNCDGMDVVYMLDGSANARGPFGLYTSGYVGLVNEINRAQMFMTNTPASQSVPAGTHGQRAAFVAYGGNNFLFAGAQGIGSSGEISGMTADKEANLAVLRTKTSTDANRLLSLAATKASDLFANAQAGSRQKAVVIFATGPIADASSVAATLASMSGVSFFGVALRPTPTETADTMAAKADLMTALPSGSPVVSLTLSEVTSQAIFGLCNPQATFGKAALAGKTVMQTCGMRTKSQCNVATCAWSDAANSCITTPCLAHKFAACPTDTSCAWTGSSISGSCHAKCFGDAASCPSGCQAANGMCMDPKCNGNPTEDACIADPEKCVFNSTASTPCQPAVCSGLSKGQCDALPNQCTFNGDVQMCVADPCKSRALSNCEGIPQCYWGQANGALRSTCNLRTPCAVRGDERSCLQVAGCAWNIDNAPATCMPAVCTGYNLDPSTRKSNCDADTRCKYVTVSDGFTCAVQECSMHGDAMACSSDDSCVWRNSACKDARYAQCPLIDIFFLVEGTTAMRQDFGRHPSGFMGVMESLRAWSRDAPWAQNGTSSGYRMGLALYGSPAAASVPQDQDIIGNGGNFMNAGAQFNQAVNFFESFVSGYAQNASGTNLLSGGLTAASNMFATGAPNRKRVLVILGASPFQDGALQGTAIGTMINDLEKMGVSIFSNIVRRFSTITPVELKAEEFMRPLASDPASTHFLFSSIENLRPMLLDKFCDPSTPAGQALGVSRDNTLPCSWLEEGECSLQRNCMWNNTAVKTCPLSTQCPNLDCMELPESLAGAFSCANCESSSGVIQCSTTPKATERGLCVPNSCALMYATEAACGVASGCTWSADRQRCDANPCPALTTGPSCNGNLGCYWMQATSTCMPSSSWRHRSQASCLAVTTTYGVAPTQAIDKANYWKAVAVPAVCVPRRCPYLTTQTDCIGSLGVTEGCAYKSSNTPKCSRKPCPYMTSLSCAADANCYWNPYDTISGSCEPVPTDGSCALSKFSNFSQCTATCGAAIQFRSRRVLSFRDVAKNPAAQTCTAVAERMSQQATGVKLGIVDSRSCTVPSNCASHCSTYTTSSDRLGCARDISCRWKNGCEPLTFRNCAELTTDTDCGKFAAACSWDTVTKFCVPSLTRCTSITSAEQCSSVTKSLSCQWSNGSSANALADSIGAPVQLVNPGPQQKPIFVFPDLAVSSDEMINGATVAIEKHYQRNKDKLALLYPSALTATWSPSAGTLTLTGSATLGDYINAIRYVTFETTSASSASRVVTWSLMSNSVYSGMTQKVFRYFSSPGISWDAASAACRSTSYWGKRGYLAVLNNADDNNVVASKLWAQGWIGASDASPDSWLWTTGASTSTFWQGPAALLGGATVGGSYANWNALTYQPTTFTSQGVNHGYIGLSGTWEAHNGMWTEAQGYVCEYGGLEGDTASAVPTVGATVVGAGGCMPQACVWRNVSACAIDSECSVADRCITKDASGTCTETVQQCVPACASLSTPQDCEIDVRCKWDTQTVPAGCSWNPCNLPRDSCLATSNCTWDPQLKCRFKTGCAAIEDAATCGLSAACTWQAATCVKKQCSNIANPTVCLQNPSCTFNAETMLCTDAACRSGDEATCSADSRCQWIDRSAFAVGFQVGGGPVKPFAQSLPPGRLGSNYVDGVTVMISQGFRRNQDRLDVSSTFLATKGWTKSFDATTGTLSIATGSTTSVTAQTVFDMLKNEVTFTTNSKSEVQRTASFAYGLKTFQTSTGSFVTYVASQVPLTFSDARAQCEASSYFGVAGRMASVPSESDALNLARFKPNGWIGATADSSNAWTWMATNAKFWQLGMGSFGPVMDVNGSTVFAYWAASQPLVAKGADRFWAVATPTGMWRSESRQSLGFACEFVAPQAVAGMSRALRPEGCFQRPCLSLTRIQCASQSNCRWFPGEERCGVDSFCSSQSSSSACAMRSGCYWNYESAMCATAAPDTCSNQPENRCNNTAEFPTCRWDSHLLTPTGTGACVKTDCVGYSVAECQSRPQCYVDAAQQQCLGRVCGFVDRTKCFKDKDCEWTGTTCQVAQCALHTSVAACTGDANCQMSNITETCERRTCMSTTNATMCQQNPACVFAGGVCRAPGCATLSGAVACNANPECFYYQNNDAGDQCVTRRCNSNLNSESACTNPSTNGAATCRWSDGSCQMNPAPGEGDVIGSCEKEIAPSLWWLWLLCVVIFALIGAIVYRLYLAYAKGMSFFEPIKNTRNFSPHMNYKDLAFEEAQQTAQETNEGYQNPRVDDNRPSINDL